MVLVNGFFMPLSYFKTDLSAKSADLLAGTSMLYLFLICHKGVIPFLYDRFSLGVFEYHVMSTSFRAAFFARYVTMVGISFFCIAPFFSSC